MPQGQAIWSGFLSVEVPGNRLRLPNYFIEFRSGRDLSQFVIFMIIAVDLQREQTLDNSLQKCAMNWLKCVQLNI